MQNTIALPPAAVISAAAAQLAEQALAAGDKARANAVNKAEAQLLKGSELIISANSFLIESRTQAGQIYRVHNVHGCSCAAASAGRTCWHAVALDIVIEAQAHYTMPALPAPARKSLAQVDAEMAELFG